MTTTPWWIGNKGTRQILEALINDSEGYLSDEQRAAARDLLTTTTRVAAEHAAERKNVTERKPRRYLPSPPDTGDGPYKPIDPRTPTQRRKPPAEKRKLEKLERDFNDSVAQKLRPGQVITDVFTAEQIAAMRRAVGLPDDS